MIVRLVSHFGRLLSVRSQRRFVTSRKQKPVPFNADCAEKQLLVDVSVISKHDAGTGIQRVVRALLRHLQSNPPSGYKVCPVAATRKHGYRHIQYNPLRAEQGAASPESTIQIRPGDIFLGLDLTANIAPFHYAEFQRWKLQGAIFHFLVYDLLPVLHPHWFNPKTRKNIKRWLETTSIFADSFICISNVVKGDLLQWLEKQYGIPYGEIPAITIPLGCDIEFSAPTSGISERHFEIFGKITETHSLLMVGTLEPRKGHAQVLNAFERLWNHSNNMNLVIVGKPGWKTDTLQNRLRRHSENGARLFWLDDASDEVVQKLYKICTGVIIASEGEGFGLPLLEASYFGKQVLARNIPAFREISGNNVTFFEDGSPEALSSAISLWIQKIGKNPTHHQHLTFIDWCTSGQILVRHLQESIH